jgi:hypothetical protein
MKLPAHYAAARAALAKCRDIEEVKQKHNQALGLEVYAFKAKDAQMIENATVVKKLAEAELGARVEAERKAGTLAKGTRGQLRGAKPGKARGRGKGNITGGALKTPPVNEKTLEDYGIDKALAKRMRKMEKMTSAELEAEVAKAARLAVASVEDRSAVIAEARAERRWGDFIGRAKRRRAAATRQSRESTAPRVTAVLRRSNRWASRTSNPLAGRRLPTPEDEFERRQAEH